MGDLIKNNNLSALLKKFEADKMEEILEEASARLGRPNGFTQKKSFAPSGVGYGSGTCFGAETEFVTDEGVKTLGEMVNKDVVVWTGHGRWGQGRDKSWSTSRGWKKARVESFGVHELKTIVLESRGVEKRIRATGSHRWIVESGSHSTAASRATPKMVVTDDLKTGDRLWSDSRVPVRPEISPDGIRAGFIYGDGSVDGGYSQRRTGSYVILHGEKDLALIDYFSDYSVSDSYVKSGEDTNFMKNNGVSCRKVYGLPRAYKNAPDLKESSSFLLGWLSGYFAADGSISSSGASVITSHSKDSVLLVRDVCAILGISTGTVRECEKLKLGKIYTEYSISLRTRDLTSEFFLVESHREHFFNTVASEKRTKAKWVVKNVEVTGDREEVFCVVEPETERFALADGILTMNCPRYWYLAFNGANFVYKNTARQRANMDTGTAAGERIAKLFDEAGLLTAAEGKVIHNDPPIFGYLDLEVEWQGEKMIGEVKTTTTEAFATRAANMKAPGYQTLQLLIYLYVKKIDKGFFVVENKNTHEFLVIPIKMTDARKAYVERVFEWMRTVKAAADNKQMPTRPFTPKSAQCKSCPVWDECWGGYVKKTAKVEGNDPKPGVVDLPPLEVEK